MGHFASYLIKNTLLFFLHHFLHSFLSKECAPPSLFLFHSIFPLPVMILGDFRPKSNMQWWIQLQVIFLSISIPIFLRFWWDGDGVRIGILSFRLPQSLKYKSSFVSSWLWVDLKVTWMFSWVCEIKHKLGCSNSMALGVFGVWNFQFVVLVIHLNVNMVLHVLLIKVLLIYKFWYFPFSMFKQIFVMGVIGWCF